MKYLEAAQVVTMANYPWPFLFSVRIIQVRTSFSFFVDLKFAKINIISTTPSRTVGRKAKPSLGKVRTFLLKS